MSVPSSKATTTKQMNTIQAECEISEDFTPDGDPYDDYDDFAIDGTAGGGTAAAAASGGGATIKNQRQTQKQNKSQDVYSSKHTRIRENRVNAPSPAKKPLSLKR